nr:UDP-N-acetylmuramoyl-tripeptide--D-alanyl-D-alanine ligase [Microbulbifer sp. HZ11]
MATSATAVSFSELLMQAKPRVLQHIARLPPPYTVFFSLSDGAQRAKVCHETAHDIDALWLKLANQARKIIKSAKITPCWFRIDWVTRRETMSWERLNTRFKNTKRGYFRYGLALDAECKIAFLEQELNGNAMLYGGNKIHHVVINRQKFRAYTDTRFGPKTPLEFDDQASVSVLSTEGIFLDSKDIKTPPKPLYGPGRNAGRRIIEELDEGSTYQLIESSGKYLASQVKPNGRFYYGWHCCFDRPINTYNTLRHTSSIYALTEAWEATGDAEMKKAIDRALHYLTGKLIQHTQLPSGDKAAFLLEANGEIKLGGNAVCLLALTKYSEVTGTKKYLSLLEELALGIQYMQDKNSGKFVHVLQYPDLTVKEEFRIIYYDGEAAFGLMRLYGLTKDDRWLQTVEKAFDYFIDNKHWQAHDHWLSYCVNELTLYRPKEKYYQFGIRNVAGYLDFVLERITTFPTLLELMMAAEKMVSRLRNQEEFTHLLAQLDLEKFYKALHTRAEYLLNGYYWPEYAMYFENPKRILGSFFIRHHAFRVRIDDVEHYLSGFIAYRNHLIQKTPKDTKAIPPLSAPPKSADISHQQPVKITTADNRPIPVADNWNRHNLTQATSGDWLTPPKDSWRATGLCIFSPGMRPGNMVVLRPENDKRFIHPTQLRNLRYTPQAIITDNPEFRPTDSTPVLKVSEVRKAILDIGRFSRKQLQGKLIGITGSSGKTTSVAMLQHVLSPWGTIGRTEHNANLPLGISWNLASIPWDAKFTVLEMAIGNMQLNSSIARPDVAMITNIHPAHLEYHHNTEEIARKKSRIFSGMGPGSIAVINRDIAEWPIIEAEAKKFSLRIISFGQHSKSDFRLNQYDSSTGAAIATARGEALSFTTGAPGLHMAMNSLACLACVDALGLDPRIALPLLPLFTPLPGRGSLSKVNIRGKKINLIDEAYNANPASMQAALQLIKHTPLAHDSAKKILVLGDMLELGDNSRHYHESLAPHISETGAQKVFLLGEQMRNLNPKLAEQGIDSSVYADSKALKKALTRSLSEEDLLLFKGSHGSGLHLLVKELLELDTA